MERQSNLTAETTFDKDSNTDSDKIKHCLVRL